MNWIHLDLQYFSGDKTEKATPKKRQEAKQKGQVAKSQDVNTAIGLLAVFLFLSFGTSFIGPHLFGILRHSFQDYMLMDLTENNIQKIVVDILKEIAYIVGPILAVALFAGIASNFAQVGFIFTSETMQPKLEKIDPIKGFKRIFSMRAVMELLKSILKIVFVGTVTFLVLWRRMNDVLSLSYKSIGDSLSIIGSLTLQMGFAASIALLFLAILDYLYQRYEYEKNLRMSKQDIKDEYKNSEGEPLIKSKIKQRQREMAMRRMMHEVPNADVVITNPTHYAICLKYDETQRDAPFVIAKGVDYVAQKIKMIANEHEIMMIENRPLARSLYDQVEIGDTIPEEFFKAVAEILAYVYRIKNKI